MNNVVIFFAFSTLLTSIASLALGIFVIYRSQIRSANFLWGLVSFSIMIWSFGLYKIVTSDNETEAIFWNRILYLGAIFIPVLYYHFISSFLNIVNNFLLKLFYVIALLLLFFNFTSDNFIKGAPPFNAFPYWLSVGFLYYFYIVFFVFLVMLSFFKILSNYKNLSGLKKIQIKYIFLTGIVGFLGGSTNFLPQTIGFYPMGNYFVFCYAVIVSYAIIKHRLMNIKLVIARSILYTVLVGTVASFFALSVFLATNYMGVQSINGKIISYIVSSVIVVVFLDPIKRVFAKLTDAIFYKDKIDYAKVLQRASSIVAKEIDLQKLLHELAILLSKELKLKKVKVFMPTNGSFILTASSASQNQTLSLTEQITLYFNQKQSIVITEELFRQKDEEQDKDKKRNIEDIAQELENIGSEMAIPIVESNKVNALFVLSQKMSGDIFGTDDINFFNLLAPQIATAIEKSKLYEEVQELNRDLQKKVDERTESLRRANLDLEDRNKYLTTMQVVVNMITRTLDLKLVTQMIADSIASELGYIGGVLSFVNGDGKLRVKAVTKNKQAKEGIDLLPDDIFRYEADLKNGYNLGVETVLTAKINFSSQMSDFFSPPVEENVMNLIQAKLGVKTIVGVPIFSEDKIIGVVHFLLAVEREGIGPLDIEMMTSLTNQVGIVSRNLALYENLQKVNYDLNEANLHLKALDKAKSEFLSIASHQLRTPVSALKGYLSMMIEGDFGPMPEKINKLLKDLFDSASRLARTINVFLNVSRIEAGRLKLEKKPMQISDLVVSVVNELSSSAQNKGLVLSYEAGTTALPLVYADGDKLREVVLNLVDNAIKYTPQGSIKIQTTVKDNILEFSSTDTGVGIDAADAQALFRKFVRGDGAAQINTGGSGLGLFIAQKIIKEHEGNIWVESAGKGKGSVFKFTVPLASKEQIAEINKVDK